MTEVVDGRRASSPVYGVKARITRLRNPQRVYRWKVSCGDFTPPLFSSWQDAVDYVLQYEA